LGLLKPPGVTNAQPGFWKNGKLGTFAQANVAFANSVAALYKDDSAFQGCYIPLENWVGSYASEETDQWAAFYRDVSAACKRLKPLSEVAISPCLPEGNYVILDSDKAATI
jgi:hypothetical protein